MAKWCSGALIAVAVAVTPWGVAAASAPELPARACDEQEQTEPAAEGATDLFELQPNTARPTFEVSLEDNSEGSDEISFVPREAKRIGRSADIAVEITDFPRASGERIDAQISIAAHANKSGRRAVVEVCLADVASFAAGRYEGTVSVFGPRFADFNYALVVTTKWPWWSAVAAIAASMIFFIFVAAVTGLVVLDITASKSRSAAAGFAGLFVAVIVGGLTYWSVYATSETWGADPATDLTAIAIASFTAAMAAFTAVSKIAQPTKTSPPTS